MMQYLADRYDTEHKLSYPHGSREYVEVRPLLSLLNPRPFPSITPTNTPT
jgi:glutathione S-transferase